MKKILLIISLLWSLPVSAFVINDKVYLNACGSNPQEYKTDPLNIQHNNPLTIYYKKYIEKEPEKKNIKVLLKRKKRR